MTRTRKGLILAAMIGLLAGCGGKDAGGAAVSAAELGQGLSPGEFKLEIEGHVRAVGPYTGDRLALRYGPTNYSESRERRDGTGGRQLVRANNEDGPYSLMMRMDLQRGDEDPDRETGSVTIQLPPDARAGQTYVLETSARAAHGEGFVYVGGYGQRLSFSGSGEVDVVEIGERLSLRFDFSGGDPEDGSARHIRGRAYQIPLSHQGEARFSLSVDDQSEDRIERTHFRNARSMMIGAGMQLNFPDDEAQPGTYRLADRPAAGVLGVQLFDYRGTEVSGQIELARDADTWSARFQFDGQGESRIRAEGGFDHVAAFGS